MKFLYATRNSAEGRKNGTLLGYWDRRYSDFKIWFPPIRKDSLQTSDKADDSSSSYLSLQLRIDLGGKCNLPLTQSASRTINKSFSSGQNAFHHDGLFFVFLGSSVLPYRSRHSSCRYASQDGRHCLVVFRLGVWKKSGGLCAGPTGWTNLWMVCTRPLFEKKDDSHCSSFNLLELVTRHATICFCILSLHMPLFITFLCFDTVSISLPTLPNLPVFTNLFLQTWSLTTPMLSRNNL